MSDTAIPVVISLDRLLCFPFVDREAAEDEKCGDGFRVPEERDVTLRVNPAETVAEVIDRSAPLLKVEIDPDVRELVDGVDWDRPSRHMAYVGIATGGSWSRLSVVDHRDGVGRLHWGVDFRDVTIGQLLDSVDQGLLEGDPTHLYICAVPPGGGLWDWQTLDGFITAVGQIGAALLFVKEASELPGWVKENVERTRERLQRFCGVLKRHERSLNERRASAARLRGLLTSARSTSDLAALLDMDDDEVVDLLHGWGYQANPDGGSGPDWTPEAALSRIVASLAEAVPLDPYWADRAAEPGTKDEILAMRIRYLEMALGNADSPEQLELPEAEEFIWPPWNATGGRRRTCRGAAEEPRSKKPDAEPDDSAAEN